MNPANLMLVFFAAFLVLAALRLFSREPKALASPAMAAVFLVVALLGIVEVIFTAGRGSFQFAAFVVLCSISCLAAAGRTLTRSYRTAPPA